MYIYAHIYMLVLHRPGEDSGSSRSGIIGGRKPPNMGTQTGSKLQSSGGTINIFNPKTISPPLNEFMLMFKHFQETEIDKVVNSLVPSLF